MVFMRGARRVSQGGALEEVGEEDGGGCSHAHTGQLSHGVVHGPIRQRTAGLPLGLAKHLHAPGDILRFQGVEDSGWMTYFGV